MKFVISGALLTALSFAASTAWGADASAAAQAPAATAESVDTSSSIDWHVAPRVSVSLGVGYMSTNAGEFVYNTPGGGKISQLNWRVESASVAKGAATVTLTDWLNVSLSGWTRIDSNNVLDDFDYLIPPYKKFSDHSHSPDTRLDSAEQGDVGFAARLYNEDGIALRAVVGYQWTDFKWSAYGGHYVYSDLGFRDLVGDFPAGELGIAYSQRFKTPYLGISATYDYDEAWQFSAAVRGSAWVVGAADIDHHVLRALVFHDKTDNAGLVDVSLGAAYNLNARTQLAGTIEYQAYTLGKGPTRAIDETDGSVYIFPGEASGIDNKTFSAMLDIRYKFEQ